MANRILLVEDNEESADMLSRRLRGRGFEVTLVVDGAAAVAAAQSCHPDVILMDMSLPVMDGWTATATIKADPALASIPIIALTAHTMAQDEAKARAAGCDGFHPKPVDFVRLLQLLATFEIVAGPPLPGAGSSRTDPAP